MAGLSVKARWALGFGACALGAALYLARAPRRQPARVAPSPSVRMAAPATSAARPRRPLPAPPPRWPFEDQSTPAVVPFQSPEAIEDARLRALPPELRRAVRHNQAPGASAALAGRSRYPADCRPAAEALRRVLPHQVPATVRPLSPAPLELGHALVRATQDRDHLLPGETALLTIEVAVDGQRAPFEVKRAELLQPATPPNTRPESLAAVMFRDDGVAPDHVARDGVATARVGLPSKLRTADGELGVRAEVSAASESGEVDFRLVATPAPVAAFTGTVREAMENGSLAFYVGVRVEKPGRYDFAGRVYDSEHRAMAVLITNGNLGPATREIRLAFCGKLVRDENIQGPWELRDVEGFLFTEGAGRPDRIPMALFSGPHTTHVYPLDAFSDGAAEKPEAPAQ